LSLQLEMGKLRPAGPRLVYCVCPGLIGDPPTWTPATMSNHLDVRLAEVLTYITSYHCKRKENREDNRIQLLLHPKANNTLTARIWQKQSTFLPSSRLDLLDLFSPFGIIWKALPLIGSRSRIRPKRKPLRGAPPPRMFVATLFLGCRHLFSDR